MARTKTLAELTAMAKAGKTTFTADDISGVMGMSGHYIRLLAKQAPNLLPGPMRDPIISCSDPRDIYNARVKFPAIPVLRYFGADI